MELQQATEGHIEGWMALARQVAPIFPGLEVFGHRCQQVFLPPKC